MAGDVATSILPLILTETVILANECTAFAAVSYRDQAASRVSAMPSGYLIELDEEAVGILVAQGSVYAFHAVDDDYRQLEGAVFRTAFEAERAARRIRRRGGGLAPTRGRKLYDAVSLG